MTMRPSAWQAYDPKTELPLGGYSVLLLVFAIFAAAACYVLNRRGLLRAEPDSRPFLERVNWVDFALLAVATHQLSWMLGRDRVLSPLRAWFSRYDSSGGVGELNEVPRGGGLLHAIGDLITCPYCLGPWVALALLTAFLLRPRVTRLALVVLSLVAASNMLHQIYSLLKHATKS